MRAFAQLFADLDTTNKTNAKLDILKDYLAQAPDADRLWLLALFTHKRPRRQVTATQLRAWAAEAAGIPDWLFEESYHTTGDLAETIALVLPLPTRPNQEPLHWWIGFMQSLAPLDEAGIKAQVLWAWQGLEPLERFMFVKLMTGGFRIGISQQLITRAVAEVCGLDKAVVAHRLMGNWQPDQTDFQQLIFGATDSQAEAPGTGLALSQPYPFCLAHPVDEAKLADLGPAADWQAEWKWDGIRAQVIVRQGELFVWTRGEELVTDKYPELQALLAPLAPASGLVLDGELLAWANDQPLPFAELQKRIGRKTLSKKLLQEVPVALVAYDLLELNGQDLRAQPLAARRAKLENLVAEANCPVLRASPVVAAHDWPQLQTARQQARTQGAEGLMLKRLESTYQTGRVRGHWWKWKVQPLTIDGVLLYAQKGHGRRATLYTDYTFGVWDGDRLVTFAKAYSGLTDAEIKEVDAFVKKNTLEKFGPVRTVKPELVFEIGFEGIQRSNRHKSGVALRFPRIIRWRQDKTAAQADTVQGLLALVEGL